MKLLLALTLLVSASAHAAEPLPLALQTPVSGVGESITLGVGRAEVAARLGSPRAVLKDGSWLFAGFHGTRDDGTRTEPGMLLVRFEKHRVAGLQLLSRQAGFTLITGDKGNRAYVSHE